MNHEQFAYWLQGFVEMNSGNPPNVWQWRMIKDHLQTCFNKVTPSYPQTLFPGNLPLPVTCSNLTGNMPSDVFGAGVIGRNRGGGAC